MENLLYYMTLLACPLMLGVMFFFMRGMMTDNKSKQNHEPNQQLQIDMNELMEQNNRLMREMEDLKKSR